MRLLVTGGAGFIGSNFVRTTVAERSGVHVTVIDSMTSAANPATLADLVATRAVELVEADITDATVMDSLLSRLPGGDDAVVHFAAEHHHDNSLGGPCHVVHASIVA